ncbi:hypothetical protein CBR_g38809 [Chara braunii]|uniref:Uncharacterized protein n=1 Tax=Chara braunii TaxID=69332 RepID=A0A388LQD7_CHABU|nr:hypothetical protein CBR_g38809 [Chara braunii]|eukprot:GBG84527.1 hypothetical protein CBR_g38809 [Chara braunii]
MHHRGCAAAVESVVEVTPFVDVAGGGTVRVVLARGNGVGHRILYAAVAVPVAHCAHLNDVATADSVGAALLHLAVAVVGVGAKLAPAAAPVEVDASSATALAAGVVAVVVMAVVAVAVAVAVAGAVELQVVVVAVLAAVVLSAEDAAVVAAVATVGRRAFAPAVVYADVDASSATVLASDVASDVDAVVVVVVVVVAGASAFDPVTFGPAVHYAGAVVASLAGLAGFALPDLGGAAAVWVGVTDEISSAAVVVVGAAAVGGDAQTLVGALRVVASVPALAIVGAVAAAFGARADPALHASGVVATAAPPVYDGEAPGHAGGAVAVATTVVVKAVVGGLQLRRHIQVACPPVWTAVPAGHARPGFAGDAAAVATAAVATAAGGQL